MKTICKCERCKQPLYSHEEIFDLDGHEGWGEVCEDCKDPLGEHPETYYHLDGLTFPDYEDSGVTVQGILVSEIGIPNPELKVELTTKLNDQKIQAFVREGYNYVDVLKVYLVNPQFGKIRLALMKPNGEEVTHVELHHGESDVVKTLANFTTARIQSVKRIL